MIVAIGTDLVAVARIDALHQRSGERFLARVYTAAERAYCLSVSRPAASLAARFCAKEAVMKCLRTGWAQGVGFRSIEVVRATSGAVSIALHDRAAEVAAALGIRAVHLSLSHDGAMAIAFAVAER